MNKKVLTLALVLLMVATFVLPAAAAGERGYERKIVVFDEGVNRQAKEKLINRFGFGLGELDIINGAVILLTPNAAALLAKMPGVISVEDDAKVFAFGKPSKPAPEQPKQEMDWGVKRIGADLVWDESSTAAGIKVAILDTGIDLSHPDLVDNIKRGINIIRPSKSENDDNGHGTHVAGIVAAANNEIGVVGVGHKAELYGVKVLDRSGSGWTSDIIKGIEWCVNNGMQVVNMSFGSKYYNESFENAVRAAYDKGLVMVAAAGNSGPDENTVAYPAKYGEVIAVSATDKSDNIASWSSRGSEVELAAPGSNINSTYKDGTYKILSGTSMAAPHVAGVAALLLAVPVPAAYDANGDGWWNPDEVRSSLRAAADDLGEPGFDNWYGFGLVNAKASVTGVK